VITYAAELAGATEQIGEVERADLAFGFFNDRASRDTSTFGTCNVFGVLAFNLGYNQGYILLTLAVLGVV